MHIPSATYRIQFHQGFRFEDALDIAAYLANLGVSHLYASPIFKACPGSLHGYDVVDPNRVNPEIGTEKDLDRLLDRLKELGMGWIQDIVPNHMAYHPDNEILMDIFENGPASPYYRFFDVDWDYPLETLHQCLLAPFLGEYFGAALESAQIRLDFSENGLSVNYYDTAWPLAIETYADFLTYGLEELKERLDSDDPDLINFLGVLYVLKSLPGADELEDRRHQITFIKRSLWNLHQRNPDIAGHIAANLAVFNGVSDRPESFNLLENLLGKQHFRLSFWKMAAEEINYRRFFNINQLICLRMEDEVVFDHSHRKILAYVHNGRFDGLRIDHIDGFHDPAGYLARLREAVGDRYIVVEKILDAEEELPPSWPIQGTSGYDFLNEVNALFCDASHAKTFARIYSEFAKPAQPYEELLPDKKRLIIGKEMAGDVDNLARLMKRIASHDRRASDITLYGLKRALVEVLAQFPVYRTYVDDDRISPRDRVYIEKALSKSAVSSPGLVNELLLIRRFLLLEWEPYLSEEKRREWVHFVMRFQQLTGPLMAKGFEDTTLYVYNRLISLNNVGGDPDRFGVTLRDFHRRIGRKRKKWPFSMNTASTHDTKRGEDARARINALSELPREWAFRVKLWAQENRNKKKRVNGRQAPDLNDEYFFYQTIIGTFPVQREAPDQEYIERIKNYLIKAVREAKVHTAWLKPDEAYEQAYLAFVEAVLQPGRFLSDFLPFCRKAAFYGMLNSLSQTLIKLTVPGVPDFYQGTELWDLSLVDPDNRRPVDFRQPRQYLDQIKQCESGDREHLIQKLLSSWPDGRIKLLLIHCLLNHRRSSPDIYTLGDYRPVRVIGRHKNRVIGFMRRLEQRRLLVLAPRLNVGLVPEGKIPVGADVWADTRLVAPSDMPTEWIDLITGRKVDTGESWHLGDLLQKFPGAVLYHSGQKIWIPTEMPEAVIEMTGASHSRRTLTK